MRTPTVLVTGTEADAMAVAVVSLQFDLPAAVVVRHHIDVEARLLTRTVSDASGVVERFQIHLEHACVTCAIREDVAPTLARLAADGRWGAIVAHLPVGAEARQVCGVLATDPRLARRLRVCSVLAVLPGAGLVQDLLGDTLLRERGAHTGADDGRGLGEATAAMIEYADTVALIGDVDDTGTALVTTLARPGARVVAGAERLDGPGLLAARHRHSVTEAWTDPAREVDLPALSSPAVWRIELRSVRPFEPDRLLEGLESLGGGRHRSRGCFWLPTRGDQVVQWDGAGGQLSIGSAGRWGARQRRTRITFVGVGRPLEELGAAFEPLLLRPDEGAFGGPTWAEGVSGAMAGDDGFEPWLGPIRGVA